MSIFHDSVSFIRLCWLFHTLSFWLKRFLCVYVYVVSMLTLVNTFQFEHFLVVCAFFSHLLYVYIYSFLGNVFFFSGDHFACFSHKMDGAKKSIARALQIHTSPNTHTQRHKYVPNFLWTIEVWSCAMFGVHLAI